MRLLRRLLLLFVAVCLGAPSLPAFAHACPHANGASASATAAESSPDPAGSHCGDEAPTPVPCPCDAECEDGGCAAPSLAMIGHAPRQGVPVPPSPTQSLAHASSASATPADRLLRPPID